MGKIQIMPDALASQVAAGEVVERPASVVKELVENALDAGAGIIEIKVERGGISLIRVVDDGHGMGRDDALMSLERHATSKITKKEDLERIITLGFRGEALPSIASVSQFRLASREAEALAGTEVVVEGGKMRDVREWGGAPGTEMEVRSLFYNIPARRKFLRAESTEFSHVEQQVRLQAIAHPEVRFTLIHGGRTCFQLPAAAGIGERVRGLVGNELSSRLVQVPKTVRRGVGISGLVGGQGVGRPTRSLQMVFLNGRPVESPAVSAALREAYRGAMPKGRYPVTFLFLEVDPAMVDVNVHPAKREVRFRDGRAVHDTVFEEVSSVLVGRRSEIRETVLSEVGGGERSAQQKTERDPVLIPTAEQHALRGDWGPLADRFREAPTGKTAAAETKVERVGMGDQEEDGGKQGLVDKNKGPAVAPKPEEVTPAFRFVGGIGRGMVLLESEEGLVILDRRAARERIVYEEARAKMSGGGVESQRLLMPITAELPPRDFDLLVQNREGLGRLGVELEPFGAKTVKVEALPVFMKSDHPIDLVNTLVEQMRGVASNGKGLRITDEALAATICRRAAGADLSPAVEPEIRSLLAQLFRCDLPYCCPRGNPTLIQMGYSELERKFGRGG